MNKKLKTEAVDHLFQAILTLKNTEYKISIAAPRISHYQDLQ